MTARILPMLGTRVRRLREQAGLTQAQVAVTAGVSRQLVGAVEAGRHLPRVDAGAALARALGVSVESLLAPAADDVVGVVEQRACPDGPVRLGRVGDRLVWAGVPLSGERWALADGVAAGADVEVLPGARPGAVVVGCDPAVGLAEELLANAGGPPLLAVTASTAAALEAVAAGRAHAAVVHGPAEALPEPPGSVRRWGLASWRVGLAAPTDAAAGWADNALAGRGDVVQREPGAASQAAFERAVRAARGTTPRGPRVHGHVEAALAARGRGLPAVAMEPAALAAGLAFAPLEVHVAQLWVAAEWVDEPGLRALGDTLVSAAFQRRVAAVGGYDLTDCGAAVAA